MIFVLKVRLQLQHVLLPVLSCCFHAVSDKANQIIRDFFKFPALRALLKRQVDNVTNSSETHLSVNAATLPV
jgi:hypothetical protein